MIDARTRREIEKIAARSLSMYVAVILWAVTHQWLQPLFNRIFS